MSKVSIGFSLLCSSSQEKAIRSQEIARIWPMKMGVKRRYTGYVFALLSGVSCIAGVDTVARAADLQEIPVPADNKNTQTGAFPPGTAISGDLYQEGGVLGLDGVSVSGTLHLDGGSISLGSSKNNVGGTTIQALTGSAPGTLLRPSFNNDSVMTPSADVSKPAQGELVINQGPDSTYGATYNGSLSGTGVLTLANGSQTLSGKNNLSGTVAVRNGTLSLTNDGAILPYQNSSPVTLSIGLAQGNEGHLLMDGSGTLIHSRVATIGNGDPNYGTSNPTDRGESDLRLKNGANFQADLVTIANEQNGVVNVESGSKLSVGILDIGDPSVAGTPVSGTLNVTGKDSFVSVDADGKETVSSVSPPSTFLGSNGAQGTINITDGGTFKSNGQILFGDSKFPTREATINVSNNGLLLAGDEQEGKAALFLDPGAQAASLNLNNGIIRNIKGENLTNQITTTVSGTSEADIQDTNLMTWTGPVSGAGTLEKTGTGIFLYTGQGATFTGPTDIQAGTVDMEGDFSHSSVAVRSGASLRGTGTVGSTVVDGGGLVSPGAVANQAVPATLHVNGDLSMAQGSILRIHGTSDMTGQSLTTAKGDGYHELTSDRLAVTGKASLAGGTLDLIVKNAGAGLTYGQAYRVLTATQGVSGQFSGLTTNLAAQYAYLDPTLAYSADAVDIVLKRNGTGFGDVGGTRNEVTAGQGVSHVGAGSGLVTALTGLTKDQARRALDNLSGELHASIRTALIQDSFYIRNAVINRLANADCDYGRNGQSVYDLKTHKKNGACYSDHAVLWGQAYGGLGHNSGDGNAALMHHNTAGFIVGADAPINHSNWRVGGLLSYGHSQFNVERGRSSSGNSNNISVGAYAGTHWGRLNLRLGADYSWNVINTRRQIAVGDYGSRVRSSYLGGTAQAYAELGYKLRAGHTVFEPFMNVAYINMQTNSFREHGNDAALRSRGTDQGVTFSTFGFRAATRVNIGKAVFMPHIMAGYRHGFGRLRPGLHEGFVAGGGTSTMDVAGVLLSQDAAVTDAGITAQVTDRIGVDLSYIGQYGNHSIESGATGSVKVSF